MRTIAVSRRAVAMLAGAMALTGAAASSAGAQGNTDVVAASATVNRPITVSTQKDLAFGNVYPGVTATVDITDASATSKQAGHVRITGHTAAGVEIKIRADGALVGPGDDIPITFTGYLTEQNTATGGATLDNDIVAGSAVTNAATLSSGAVGTLHLFIGGSITPPDQQAQGTYTANVDIEVRYTGT